MLTVVLQTLYSTDFTTPVCSHLYCWVLNFKLLCLAEKRTSSLVSPWKSWRSNFPVEWKISTRSSIGLRIGSLNMQSYKPLSKHFIKNKWKHTLGLFINDVAQVGITLLWHCIWSKRGNFAWRLLWINPIQIFMINSIGILPKYNNSGLIMSPC